MANCPKCATPPKNASSKFCFKCGTKLEAAVPASQSPLRSTPASVAKPATLVRSSAVSSSPTRTIPVAQSSARTGPSSPARVSPAFAKAYSTATPTRNTPNTSSSAVPAWKLRQQEKQREEEERKKKLEEESNAKQAALVKSLSSQSPSTPSSTAVPTLSCTPAPTPAARSGLTKSTSNAPSRPSRAAEPTPATSLKSPLPESRTTRDSKGTARHSKIDIDTSELEKHGRLAGLDVEGIAISKKSETGMTTSEVERAAGGGSRGNKPAPAKRVIAAPAPASAATASPASGSSSLAPPAKGGIANKWAQTMQAKKNEEFMAERQKTRDRRGRATAFVDKEIRQVIEILKKKPGRRCPYGELFRETQESLSALSATLAVARKRKVVTFEGQAMLMQGTHDNVLIILLKDEIEDTQAFVSVYGAAPVNPGNLPNQPTSGPTKCHMCSKSVYPTERIAANGKVMHKTCFRCCMCNMVLKLAAYAYNGDKFFCETHFKQQMQEKGGYDF